MPEVYNWQLGREMAYPYDARFPEWQFAFVFNINRCIACQTCTMACKSTWTFSKGQEHMWWNNVETKPYGGYPQYWDVKGLELLESVNPGGQTWSPSKADAKSPYGRYDGMTIFEGAAKRPTEAGDRALGYIPTDEEWRHPNIHEDSATAYEGGPFGLSKSGANLPEHKTWFFYLQRLCNHCSYPACLAACPRNAIYKRPEDGIVLIDQERCRGYRKCVAACPYKKSMFRPTTRVSEKCIACYPRVEGKDPLGGGAPMETRCMSACVGKIRMQGLVKMNRETGDWADDPKNPLTFLVKVAKVALPLYPQFGTEPNGYYIPPRWAPRAYLHQMFGPGVDAAIAAYTAPSRELLAVLQLFRATQKMIFRFEIEPGKKVFERDIAGKKWEMFNDTVIAFDHKGTEIVRTTVEEPVIVRSQAHQNSI
ncbi:MAG: 4Fe-4S dicluster domain-containing protein [Planctomycetes bacterium]|nr:4Fe-4S dicluster domain-containing protein [Planctomycetota bacterium]MBI3843303.1 4Fe-4S dicluster domain-containing protein [Planctomycetota bacterium]